MTYCSSLIPILINEEYICCVLLFPLFMTEVRENKSMFFFYLSCVHSVFEKTKCQSNMIASLALRQRFFLYSFIYITIKK